MISNKNKSPVLRVKVEPALERIWRIDDLQVATVSYVVNINVHKLNADV
jgi:hypothetical protein